MKAVMVWNLELYTGLLPEGAHIGTGSLHNLPGIELDMIWWGNEAMPDQGVLNRYDVFFVHLFADMPHITQIRELRPDALIVAVPDAYMDDVFINRNPAEELHYISQLQAADVIGVVSESNRQFYSVFGKPMVHIPMPIGTEDFFAQVRNQAKEDFILAVDHGAHSVDCTIPNMAALRLIINQHPELNIVYFNPSRMAGDYARAFGLEVLFLPKMNLQTLSMVAGRARIGIDLYTRHGCGRHEMVMAYTGTPVVGSSWTGGYPSLKHNPWYVNNAAEQACQLLDDKSFYAHVRDGQLRWVQERNSFESCVEQWDAAMAMIERQFAGKVPA